MHNHALRKRVPSWNARGFKWALLPFGETILEAVLDVYSGIWTDRQRRAGNTVALMNCAKLC